MIRILKRNTNTASQSFNHNYKSNMIVTTDICGVKFGARIKNFGDFTKEIVTKIFDVRPKLSVEETRKRNNDITTTAIQAVTTF